MARKNKNKEKARGAQPLSLSGVSHPEANASSSRLPIGSMQRGEKKASTGGVVSIPAPVYQVTDSEEEDSSGIEEGEVILAMDKRREKKASNGDDSVSSSSNSPLPSISARTSSPARPPIPPGAPPIAPRSVMSSSRLNLVPQQQQQQQQQQQNRSSNTVSNGPERPSGPRYGAHAMSSNVPPQSSSNYQPNWSDGEKAEAMKLIKEIAALGLNPAQLVKAGIRQDIVAACCYELRLPFSVQDRSSSAAPSSSSTRAAVPIQEPDVPQGSHKKAQTGLARLPPKPSSTFVDRESEGAANYQTGQQVRNGQRQISRRNDPQAKNVTGQRIVIDLNLDTSSESDSIDMEQGSLISSTSTSRTPSSLHRSLPNLTASTSTLSSGGSIQTGGEQPGSSLESVSLGSQVPSAMEAMRQAALASMKRKNAAAEGQTSLMSSLSSTRKVRQMTASTSDNDVEPDSLRNGSIADVPKGPRAGRTNYHDIDAPEVQTNDSRDEIEEDPYGVNSSEYSVSLDSDFRMADPRQTKRPKLSYADDYSWDVDAPIGEVDLEAPLPSLQTTSRVPVGSASKAPFVTTGTQTKRPKAADLMDLSSSVYPVASRSTPFLPNTSRQRVIVDYSDDEDEEEDDEDGQIRRASTAFIALIWKQMNGSDDNMDKTSSLPVPVDANPKKRASPVLSRSTSEAVLTLSKKEEEIREMTAKIQELERRMGQAPTDPRVIDNAARVVVEARQSIVSDEREAVAGQGSANTTTTAEEAGNNLVKELAMPSYESPFSRHPGLRQTLNKNG